MAKKHPKKTNIDRILDQNIAKIRRKRASKNNSRPIILDNTILFEVITELDSVVRGGATGKTKELAQDLSVKAKQQARERKAATEERLKRVKNIRKKLEEKQKEEAYNLKKAREERISMLRAKIESLVDQRTFAQRKGKDTPKIKIKLQNAEKKLNILTKDMASNRPLRAQIELERRIKQAKKIEEAEEGIDKLIEKLAEMQATNKDNRWEEQISRITQQIQNTEQEVNKSATNLADFLDKQFYSNIWQQKLDAEKEDYILGTRIPQPPQDTATDEPESEEPLYTVPKDVVPYWERPENIPQNVYENKKTISNITDRLMEQLYDTLN
tara:strand:- start:2696 stop:3676 length:981 start_codon:yes stop_codon:yes gene_type:complete